MTRISFWQPAGTYDVPGKGEFPQEFAPGAWDGQIGKQVPMKGPAGEALGLCTLVAAEVAPDGSGVTMTIELPEDRVPVLSPAAETMSYVFRDPDPDLVPHDPVSAKPLRITWKT